MDNSQKLLELLNEVSVLVPTLFFVGKMADGRGALYMGSPKGKRSDKETDIGLVIAGMMNEQGQAKDILLSAVSFWLSKHPDLWEKLKVAMDAAITREMSVANAIDKLNLKES